MYVAGWVCQPVTLFSIRFGERQDLSGWRLSMWHCLKLGYLKALWFLFLLNCHELVGPIHSPSWDHHALTLGSRCAVWFMTTPYNNNHNDYIYIYTHATIDTSYWPYIHQTEINPLFRRNIQRMTVLCKVQLHGPLGLGAMRLHSSCFDELGYDDCFSCCYGIMA